MMDLFNDLTMGPHGFFSYVVYIGNVLWTCGIPPISFLWQVRQRFHHRTPTTAMVARRSTAASTSKRSPIKAAPTISQLEAGKKAGKKRYRNAKKTDEAYLGYIKRGKEFLVKLVKGLGDHGEDGKPVSKTKLMRYTEAFENPPNEFSAEMLEHWLVQKCFNEDLGKSTADGIHAAFIRYWDNM
jgi:hypothetical protein